MNHARLTITFLILACTLLFLSACGDRRRVYNGGDYTGEMQNFVPDGYGDLNAPQFYYIGNWKQGKYDGFGILSQGDSTYVGQFKDGKREGQGTLRFKHAHIKYSGQWTGDRRNGEGTLTDSAGCTWQGKWKNNKLRYGTMTDTLGVYKGVFNEDLQPDGYGQFLSTDKLTHYEGEWSNGRHNKFGFNTQLGNAVQCGWWKNGKFLGEKMRYTSSRVYGIDISRYQHRPERWIRHRRKRYKVGTPINWQQLRIVHLGASHNQNVVGQVNYPISFCYIKSTQGKSITSRYYAGDARGARSVGIKVGAYHFMSPVSGSLQAHWFLKNTFIGANDLPPMLDVELTHAQIIKMGGRQVLYREILAWLHIVRNKTGKKPILYVSQNFINTYLLGAPAELLSYNVWVARYGQYRPYVQLLYWQLSPYGRVRGIKGDVDINVFNGSMEQFHRYVDSNYDELP